MSKFEYLPELIVETSKYVSVPIVGSLVSSDDTGFTYDVGNQKNAEYLSWYNLNSQKTTIKTRRNPTFHFGRPLQKTDFYVIPDEELCKELVELTGVSTVLPVIVPPEYDTPKKAAKYIVDNDFSYDYSKSGITYSGFMPGVLLNTRKNNNDDTLSLMLDTDMGYKRAYSKARKKDARFVQQSLLHFITLNEFIQHAVSSDNMNLNFADYIRDESNVENIKDKFTRLEFSNGKYSDLIKKVLIINPFPDNGMPLTLNAYTNPEKREAFYPLTAQVTVDILIAFYGIIRYFGYGQALSKEKIEYYEYLKETKVYKNTYDVKNVMSELFASLDKTKTGKSDKKRDNNVFNTNNAKMFSKITFGKRVDSYITEFFDTKSEAEFNDIAEVIRVLYEDVEAKWKRNDDIATVLNGFGYDYLSNHMKPTNMIALFLLFNKSSETMHGKYVRNITKFLDNNLRSLKEDDVAKRDLIADLIYEISFNIVNVVAYKASADVTIVDDDIELDEVSLPFVLNSFLSSYEIDDKHDKYDNRKFIETLRDIGM